jgi:monoamine oxidase
MTEPIDLLETLRAGLPLTTAPRHVVIVGAGMAGLTAGMLLKEAGHKVTILEARNRLGGRIYTYRGFAGQMYGEFGAMRFPRQHPLGQHLIHERFRLPTKSFGMDDQDTFVYMQGRGVRRSQFSGGSFDVGLGQAERAQEPATLLKDVMAPLIELAEQPGGWDRVVEQYDRYSLLGYLLERGVSEQALWLLGPLFNIEGRFHFSLVEWFAHWYDDVFGDLEYIEAGSDSLPNAFGPILMADTRLGAEVQSIDQHPDGVSVRYRDSVGGRGEVKAD